MDGSEDLLMYELAQLPDLLPELPGLDEPLSSGGHLHSQQVTSCAVHQRRLLLSLLRRPLSTAPPPNALPSLTQQVD